MSGQRKGMGGGPPKIDIPITAMLDMSFQLLFFFILNYHPSAMEGQMAMSLPAKIEEAAKEKDNPDPKSSDKPDELESLPADLTVLVKTQNDGTNNGLISAISVRDRSGETNIAPLDSDLSALTKYLDKSKEGLSNKEEVSIQGDNRLSWASVIKVMDACKRAGFRTGFGQPPDLAAGGQ